MWCCTLLANLFMQGVYKRTPEELAALATGGRDDSPGRVRAGLLRRLVRSKGPALRGRETA